VSGFLQYSHFGTFETFLTFFYCLALWVALITLQQPQFKWFLLLGLICGLAISTKVVSLYLLALPVLVALLTQPVMQQTSDTPLWKLVILDTSVTRALQNPKLWVALLSLVLVFVVTNPFTFLDYGSFRNSIEYENGVATGSLPVFYTRGFLDTTPILYQLQHVLPFISGYLFTLLAGLAIVWLIVTTFRTRDHTKHILFILLLVFGGYLVFHFLLYVKWTRYMVPALPFLMLSIALVGQHLSQKWRHYLIHLGTILLFSLMGIEIIVRGMSFFQLYRTEDTRVQAAEWMRTNVPPEKVVLSEHHDPGIIPFNGIFQTPISLFNFYEYDTHPESQWTSQELSRQLHVADYIIIPSRRVYTSAQYHPQQFPNAYRYYSALFVHHLGFEQVYATKQQNCLLPDHWPSWVRTVGCPVNIYQAEETFEVFDHPTVLIFEKKSPLTVEEYEDILTAP
jgi:hypothetical protein